MLTDSPDYDYRQEKRAAAIFEDLRQDVEIDPDMFAGLSPRDVEIKLAVVECFDEVSHVVHAPHVSQNPRPASGSTDAREALPPGVVDVGEHPLRGDAAHTGELATSDGLAAWLVTNAMRMAAAHPEMAAHYRQQATRECGCLLAWQERLRVEIIAILSRPSRLRPRPEHVTFPWAPPGLGAALRSVVGADWQRVTLGRGGGSDGAQGVPAIVEEVARLVDVTFHDDLATACAIDAGATSAEAVRRVSGIPEKRIPAAIARLEKDRIIVNEGTPRKPCFQPNS
jgi:hypothetical protein